jgi:hypothetical protein
MIELAAIAGLFWFAHRLRRALRKIPPARPIEVHVHVHHHFPDGGPGEEQPVEEPLREEGVGNVVLFKPRRAA